MAQKITHKKNGLTTMSGEGGVGGGGETVSASPRWSSSNSSTTSASFPASPAGINGKKDVSGEVTYDIPQKKKKKGK